MRRITKLGLFASLMVVGGVFRLGMSLRVEATETGHIRVVSGLYPLYSKVYAEGISIDTISGFAVGYSKGLFYQIDKRTFYAVHDSAETCQTTIIDTAGNTLFTGRNVGIGEFNGECGTINVFSYTDKSGNTHRIDAYGNSPDNEDYEVHVYDIFPIEYVP